jgi:3-oxoacyl-[acyl-carrier-protein] synthase III
MKILTVKRAIPGLAISNEFVVDAVRAANRDRFSREDLEVLERRLSRFLEAAGTRIRHRLAPGENAIGFALDAGRRALADAEVDPNSIDLLLYAGVGRGWIEPAVANVVQHELGLSNATCFDVVDACASWLRALQMIHSYFRAGIYRSAMIVNCECGFPTYRDWKLDRLDDLEHRAAEWTTGEAATATVLSADGPNDDYHFVFRNFGAGATLCMYPLPGMADFLIGTPDVRMVPLRFFALSSELLATVSEKVVEVFSGDPELRGRTYDIGFGHEASTRINRGLAKRLGLPYERYVSTHERYGNTVSASVPLGMSLALEEGRLKRGDQVLILVGASGISVGLASFTF